MLKDESRCIRCGLCAARCPAGTITMEAYDLVPTAPTGLMSIESIDRSLRREALLNGKRSEEVIHAGRKRPED